LQNNTFSTLFVGQNLIKLSSVDSTNTYLKSLLSKSEPLPEGTVILAENQFDGRGQQQSKWLSEPGKNLTFSLLLYPSFIPIERQFDLNILVSEAVYRALSKLLSYKLAIKWPNDIYYGDAKLGGILIENTIVGNKLKNCVIGIGLNVNQQMIGLDLGRKIASISEILHENVNLTPLLGEICTQIELNYLRIRSGKADDLRHSYTTHLYQLNRVASFRDKERIFEGRIVGVSNEGLLQIEDDDAKLIEYGFKEIVFL